MAKTARSFVGALILVCVSQVNRLEARVISSLQGPLCGVYCVYEGLRTLGHREVVLGDLVTPAYISSGSGSTANDLVAAATDLGAGGHAFAMWGFVHLQLIRTPAVLHVSRSIPGVYDHWVLFLGHGDEGRLRILDVAFGLEEWKVSDLLSRWDGSGVLLTRQADTRAVSDVVMIQAVAALTACVALTILGAGVFLFKSCVSRWPYRTMGLSLLLNALILVAAVGFAASSDAVGALSWIGAHDLDIELPEVSGEWVRNALRTDPPFVIVIDSRHRDAFDQAHIPGAISLPVDSSPGVFESSVQHLKKDGLIVVYCQNKSCTFSDAVGARLHLSGFRRVVIYRNGWQDWRSL